MKVASDPAIAAVDELVGAVDAHRRQQEASGALRARRVRYMEDFVFETLENRYGSYGIEALGGRQAVLKRLREAAATSGFALAYELGREIEAALREPA